MITIGEITGLLPPKRYCDGKHKHKSIGAGEAHIRAMVRSGRIDEEHAKKLRAYRCGNCGWFHVGKTREPIDVETS